METNPQSVDFTVKLYKKDSYFLVSMDPHELSSDVLCSVRNYIDAHRFLVALVASYDPNYFIMKDKTYDSMGNVVIVISSQGYFREIS